MKVNASKTKTMVITSSSKDQKWDPELMAGDTRIKLEQLYRFLGIKVPSDLRFKSHVETVVATCRKRALVLKCMRPRTGEILTKFKG